MPLGSGFTTSHSYCELVKPDPDFPSSMSQAHELPNQKSTPNSIDASNCQGDMSRGRLF